MALAAADAAAVSPLKGVRLYSGLGKHITGTCA